ncbi:MAG: peptide chain release factor N(5)-glutamine methyltransferase [Clostridiales bacterium]|nr:peptide chain release factor N(5)-glutamine methyltransferase [Clostridiales bacterium]
MTLYGLLGEGCACLRAAGVPDAERDAQLLLLAAFQTDLARFLLIRGRELSDDEADMSRIKRYREMIRERAERIPAQQILGSQDFMGLEFEVNEHVLIPRQDTETLAELVLEEQKEKEIRLLDLCTGSGCIAISLAVRGGYRYVAGTDLSAEALAVARRNARRLTGEDGRVTFFEGDLFGALPADVPAFDVITANPPYIPSEVIRTLEPEVREHEPRLALDGSEDGLIYYRKIAREAVWYLAPGGSIYLEIGWDQAAVVSALLEEHGFEQIRVVKDLAGKDRVVCAHFVKEKENDV